MPNLNATITSLAQNFAKQLVEALRSLSLEEILAATGAAAPKRPGATKGAAKGATKAASKPQATATTARAGTLSAEAIVAVLKKHKGGLRAELLRRELGAPKPAFNYHVQKAIAAKLVTKRGVKRATTYTAR